MTQHPNAAGNPQNHKEQIVADGENTTSLTARQAQFVQEYMIDLNGAQAAVRAGYAPKSAAVEACRLLSNANIQAHLAKSMQKRAESVEFGQREVLRRWIDIATADPNELIQNRRAPCRHCHGVSHGYQWKTEREFNEAVLEAVARENPIPTNAGGFGYRVTDPVNPDCPECSGEGIGYVLAADTRTLTGPARLLYAGAKQTRDGMEIKMHDQGKALENVARHLGMLVDKPELKVTGDLTVLHTTDPAEAARQYRKMVEGK